MKKKRLLTHFCVALSTITLLLGIPVNGSLQSPINPKEKPLIAVVIMVKNEGSFIAPTLQPLVEAGIKDFFVYDTGSTDGTPELAEQFFKDSDIINYHIRKEPFVDFAKSRNRAMDIADEIFPTATFYVFLDAEWYARNGQELVAFCEQHKYESDAAYFVRLQSPDFRLYKPCLIRREAHPRFLAPVHEYLNCYVPQRVPDSFYFELNRSEVGHEKSKHRYKRDLEILTKEYQEHPYDSRNVYYLAQTYSCLLDFPNAYKHYKLRTTMAGFEEENYSALLKMGLLVSEMSKNDPQYTWDLALEHYLQAFSIRPTRIEPLIFIAQHYGIVGDYNTCFLFARRALEIPIPTDVNDVEDNFYTSLRYILVSASALYAGAYDIGLWATKKALEANPQADYLQKNLNVYIDAINRTKQASQNQGEHACA